MIVLKVVSNDAKTIKNVAKELLQTNLAINVSIESNVIHYTLINDELIPQQIHILSAKTKALLFNHIDDFLTKNFGDNLTEIYSVPIVHMDWKQADQLVKDVKPV